MQGLVEVPLPQLRVRCALASDRRGGRSLESGGYAKLAPMVVQQGQPAESRGASSWACCGTLLPLGVMQGPMVASAVDAATAHITAQCHGQTELKLFWHKQGYPYDTEPATATHP